jgi:release factor glutamine methyltransferase
MHLRDITQRIGSSLEARMLIKHHTDLSDSDLIGMNDIPLSNNQKQALELSIQKRLQGCPISKIIGIKEFYGRDFITNENVLDPRPETEQIIDLVKAYIQKQSLETLKILDIGTGSGCLMTTLLCELPQAIGTASDISKEALDTAKQNAHRLNVQNRITLIQSDWLQNITDTYDIIVSNPPYIETSTIQTLATEVCDFDPRLALDGGKDGLLPYQIICPQIRHFLNQGGFMALEHGTGQSQDIQILLKSNNFKEIQSHTDYAGHDRIITTRV